MNSDAVITSAVVAGVAAVAAVGYLYREQTQKAAVSTYEVVSAQASAAATKGAEVAKSLQATAVASCNTVATYSSSACNTVASYSNSAWESVAAALKRIKSQRSLRRVRSFPIIADEDDVKTRKDQKKEKKPKAVKKATQESERMGVPVRVVAK